MNAIPVLYPARSAELLSNPQPSFQSIMRDPVPESPEIALSVAVAAVCAYFAIRETMYREHLEYLAAIKLDPAA